MLYYVIFTYLFLIGAKTVENTIPVWNIVLAPVTLPILLGRWLTMMLK